VYGNPDPEMRWHAWLARVKRLPTFRAREQFLALLQNPHADELSLQRLEMLAYPDHRHVLLPGEG
jgi:hypothetical protein